MTYSATTYRLLISAPGDVPTSDVDAVIGAVGRWNAIYGPQFGVAVVPIHWRLHSAPEHGDRPQASLNAQLVDDADIVLALFWGRLGTHTGVDESGTVEEINRAHVRGAYVALLHRKNALPIDVDADQLGKLRAFFDAVRDRSLVLNYTDEGELARHVDAVILRAATQAAASTEAAATATPSPAMIWPRIDSADVVKTDRQGRVRTQRRLRLVLSNSGQAPARNVRFRLEPETEGEGMPLLLDEERPLEVLPPQGEASYGIHLHSGVAAQARCVVSWEDDAGFHENSATVRFY